MTWPNAIEFLTQNLSPPPDVQLEVLQQSKALNAPHAHYGTQHRITYAPKIGSHWYGKITLFYTKLNWSERPALKVPALEFATLTSKASLVQKLSDHFEIQVTPEDLFLDAIVPVMVDGVTFFDIQANADSLLWMGCLRIEAA